MEPTEVTFPAGSLAESGTVLAVLDVPGHPDRVGVVVDITPFHPIDHAWPDQPADRGSLGGWPVVDCLTGTVGPGGTVQIGSAITARRGDGGWAWVVVHVLQRGDRLPQPGQRVALEVDRDFRAALNAGHTACHLAALAMNQAAAHLWSKPAPRIDSLGSPDLDSLALVASRIGPGRATDTYRLGTSIRKKGLRSAELLQALPWLQDQVTATVRRWADSGADVTIDTGGDRTLTARRVWRCTLPEGPASYPCGGTHLASLAELDDDLRVIYEPTEQGFTVQTVVG